MEWTTSVDIAPPYLMFVGDTEDELFAKTGFGIVQWRPELCMGQCRSMRTAVDLGLRDMTPAEAVSEGAKSMIVGVANVGGSFPDTWMGSLHEAVGAGLDIVAGMHTRLADLPGLAAAARAAGVRLVDVRVPPRNLPVGTGTKRSGRRLLTVGTDCATGKKYTALAIEREMKNRDMKATFRATGQTGIMIAGAGIPIDAVVSDFVSGAAEVLSPANDADHWDVIEGQGAIFHPGYAGVTLGLIHGSQPDAIVLCHDATRTTIDLWDGYPIQDLQTSIHTYLHLGSLTNPKIRCVGVSIDTSKLAAETREQYLDDLSSRLGTPCVDPLVDGVGSIVDELGEKE
jgi:uncharacterized NAD-dependent epimerase/dehydratase family protein